MTDVVLCAELTDKKRTASAAVRGSGWIDRAFSAGVLSVKGSRPPTETAVLCAFQPKRLFEAEAHAIFAVWGAWYQVDSVT
jgi:hypothetical protein